MIFDLTHHLDVLRRTHGIIRIAIISSTDYARYQASGVNKDGVRVQGLPDGRASFATNYGEQAIKNLLDLWSITPEYWVVLREYDNHYEDAIYVTDMDGRYVRVTTGMLDQLFGYITVQSASLEDLDTAIEAVRFGWLDDYERLAVSTLTS